jgi:hypothetical protein
MKTVIKYLLMVLLFNLIPQLLCGQANDNKIADNSFYRTIKCEVWRNLRDLSLLRKGDTLEFSSRKYNKRNSKQDNSNYIKKQYGDIMFTRNHKIKQLTYSPIKTQILKAGEVKLKLIWVEIGTWKKKDSCFIITLDKREIKLNWKQHDSTYLNFSVVDVREN